MSPSSKNVSDERYQAFLRNSQEGIWRVELEKPISTKLPASKQIKLMYKYGYMAECNDAMAYMYGANSPDDLVGLRLGDLLIESDPGNTAYLTAFIEAGYKLSGVESHEKDRDGKDKYFRNSLIGILENGYVLRAWGTQQDVTEQHYAIADKLKSEAHLRLALQASKLGTWEWNIETGELIWSDELKVLFGLKPTDEITFEKYVSMLHPEYRKAMMKTIKNAIKTGDPYSIEHQIVWPDGSTHWLLGQGQTFINEGKPEYMIGTSINIEDVKSTQHRTTELELKNTQLEQRRLELMELNNVKDEFISIASHQLRTPATGVKQYIGMLLEGFAGPLSEEQRAMLRAAYQSNERQIDIVNDLLKVAQIDSGKVKINKRRTNVHKLISEIAIDLRAKFTANKQQLLVDQPKTPLWCNMDSQLMRMVLENLIDNASKYSPYGSSVKVQVKQEAEKIQIKIIDHGVGISKENQAKLFQKFSRIYNKHTSSVEGTGLGLYWSKTVVELHKGTIRVTSKLGIGSTFIIELPCKAR